MMKECENVKHKIANKTNIIKNKKRQLYID